MTALPTAHALLTADQERALAATIPPLDAAPLGYVRGLPLTPAGRALINAAPGGTKTSPSLRRCR